MFAREEHRTTRTIREAIKVEKRPNNLKARDDTQSFHQHGLTYTITQESKSIGRRPVIRSE